MNRAVNEVPRKGLQGESEPETRCLSQWNDLDQVNNPLTPARQADCKARCFPIGCSAARVALNPLTR